MRWNELYKSETELVNAMLKTKSDSQKFYPYQLVKGYTYIESFKKHYAEKGSLTEKQMIQVKRLAGEIYKNLNWDCYK